MHLDQGILTIESYVNLLKSSHFRSIESFSNQFIKNNQTALKAYNRKWVSDPFHQWSRQYEYPFVFLQIRDYMNANQTAHLNILDAGSGVTFFPYYLSSTFQNIKVNCCDSDTSLGDIFSKINKNANLPNNFFPSDIRNLPFKGSTYDIVYCISVLEHTNDFEMVIKEFKRVIKQNGLLIVTFDISIDGLDDIPIEKASELIGRLEDFFHTTKGFNSKQALDQIHTKEILNTQYIKTFDKNLLPWKCSWSKKVKSILRFRRPQPFFSNLTCFCETLIKR